MLKSILLPKLYFNMSFKRMALFALVGLVVVASQPTESRGDLIFEFDTTFNGDSPTSSAPYLTAVFTNSGANMVTLKLTSGLDVASEFVDMVTFNVNPAITFSDLSFTYDSGISGSRTSALNDVTLQGSGNAGRNFDFGINWGANVFNGVGNMATFKITNNGGTLSENDFNFQNNSGSIFVGAHIQGIPVIGGGTTSGAIGGTLVPEPTSLISFATVVGLCGLRRRRGK